MGEMSEGSQKVQTSSYKISHEDVIYSMVTKANNIVYLKVAKSKL